VVLFPRSRGLPLARLPAFDKDLIALYGITGQAMHR
jgi:hypothetical protein